MLPVAYHPAYYCPEATNLTSTRKQKEVYERAMAKGLITSSDLLDVPLASPAEIELAHDRAFVRAVQTGFPRHLAESANRWTVSDPGEQAFHWSPAFAELVFRTAGGQRVAAQAALQHGIALNLASGAHHAEYRMGGGFCTFNYLVSAPRLLMQQGAIERVLVIDFDEHQGNGTWEITQQDRRFFCYDVAGSYFGVPPHDGEDGIYIVLDPHDPVTSYRAALQRIPGIIAAFKPDLIEYQAGMDSWERDPLSATRGVSAEFLAERDEAVLSYAREAGVPIVVNLAGGYVADGHPRTADLHVKTIEVARRVFGG